MIIVIVVSVATAMVSTNQAPGPVPDGGGGSYGYTISLMMFALPVAALAMWFRRHRARLNRHWDAFWITFSIIVGLWSVLDILLARTFFRFPNPDATLGINVIGYDPALGWGAHVPIEEFAFYILGCAFIVLGYIWSSEAWFGEYQLSDGEYDRATAGQQLIALFDLRIARFGVAFVLAAMALKAVLPHDPEPGFPGYLTFLTLIVIVPTSMFFHVVLKLINVRAMVFTLQALLLVALMWEVTLALPYGWWNYNHSQMLGIFVTPWSNLPIEAVALWFAATWSNIAIFEVAKLVLHKRRTAPASTAPDAGPGVTSPVNSAVG